MNKRKKQIEIEKKKKIKQLPGVPFDPLDNDYPKNHQIILPGTFQSTGGTFGGQTENPDKNDDYIYY